MRLFAASWAASSAPMASDVLASSAHEHIGAFSICQRATLFSRQRAHLAAAMPKKCITARSIALGDIAFRNSVTRKAFTVVDAAPIEIKLMSIQLSMCLIAECAIAFRFTKSPRGRPCAFLHNDADVMHHRLPSRGDITYCRCLLCR